MMQTDSIQIHLYDAKKGKVPFAKWLDALKDIKGRAAVHKRLARIRLGHIGDYRSIGHDVYEIRIHYGPGYRVYFGFESEKVIILLFGGDKGSQKRDVKKAKKYWEDYRSC